MTSGRRAKAQRRAAHDRGDLPVALQREPGVRTFDGELAQGVASIAAWCEHMTDIADARRATHDALIELLGERREGGVYWRWEQGAAARALLDDVHPVTVTDEHANNVRRRMHAMLREYGGWIVVAFAAASESTA